MTAGLVSHHPGASANDPVGRPDRTEEDRAVLAQSLAGLRTIDPDIDELLEARDGSGVLAPTEVAVVVERALSAALRKLEADAELQRAGTHLVTAGALPTVAVLLELVGVDRTTVHRATGGALAAPEAPLEIPEELARQLGWLEEIDLREPAPGFPGFWDNAGETPGGGAAFVVGRGETPDDRAGRAAAPPGSAHRVIATTVPAPVPADVPRPAPRQIETPVGFGDRLFIRGSLGAGMAVLAVMVAVGIFLAVEATQALRSTGVVSFITTSEWQPDRGEFGIAAVLVFTVAIALVAVCIAFPISLGTALFITEVAPPRFRSTLVGLVDLMAAVPSVVYGLWGLFFFQGQVIGLSRWLSTWLDWIPIFRVTGADPTSPLSSGTVYTASTFIAGVVVALMVMPIQCTIMREVFSQVPTGEREGAFALGATRWGMIRIVALPFGQGGIIGGTMLGLGRALGETIAVLLIISPKFDINLRVLEAGSNSVSSLIALRYSEASGFGLSALFAAGLALFALTLVVNFTASAFVARSRSGASSEA